MLATCFASLANFDVKSIEFSDIMALSCRSTCVQNDHLSLFFENKIFTSLTVEIVELWESSLKGRGKDKFFIGDSKLRDQEDIERS